MERSKLVHQLFRALPISLSCPSFCFLLCRKPAEIRSTHWLQGKHYTGYRDSEQGVAERVSCEEVNNRD